MKIEIVPVSWLKETEAKREHGDIEELKKSIEQVGLLNPITVNQSGRLLAGRRRFQSLIELGWTEIPVRILNSNGPVFDFKVALDENIKRKNLSDVEVAEALKEYQELKEQEEGKARRGERTDLTSLNFSKVRTQQKTGEEFGIPRQAVSRAIKIARTVEEYPDLRPLQKGSVILQKAEKRKRHHDAALRMSESNEWYTPLVYIEAARKVLGIIDIDPASCEEANKTVKAAAYFDKNIDGLKQDWPGKVWLNPPYGGLSGSFTSKLIEQYEGGKTTEAILLVNANSTDTRWFHSLWNYVLYFTDHRINFISSNNNSSGSTHGSVFVYFGPDPNKFANEFY